jgi:isoleucyl-tRNA synthetase
VVGPRFREQFEMVEPLVLSEVNVKQIEYLADTSGVITKKIKPNFPKLGGKLGPKLKAVGNALAAFDQNDIRTIETTGQYELNIEGEPLVLQLDEVDITSEDIPGWLVASEGRITVALDITITPELLAEGNARELVNRIQNLRKEMELNVTDRINVQVQKHEEINSAIINFNAYIRTEVLAENLLLVDHVNNGNILDVNGISLYIAINKN